MVENRKLIELLDIEPEKFRIKDDPKTIVSGQLVGTINYCVPEEKFSNEERDKLAFENAPASANAYLIGGVGFARGEKGQRTFFYKIEVPEKKAE